MKKSLMIFAVLIFAVVFTSHLQAQVKIDGLFFDWPSQTQLDVAPNTPSILFSEGGETNPPRGLTDPNYFINMDLSHIYMTDDADFVYVRVMMNPGANVNNIPTDTSYHSSGAIAIYISVDPGAHDTTGLTWGWWGSGYDFFVQTFPIDTGLHKSVYPQAVWEHIQDGTGWSFVVYDSTIGAQVAWNAAGNQMECAIPKSQLFHSHYMSNFVMPDSIAIMVYAGENGSPWRADYACNAGVKGYMVPIEKPGIVNIDGLFFDWQSSWQLDAAPNATSLTFAEGGETNPPRGSTDPNYFINMDLSHIYAVPDDDFVYMRINMASGANVNNILTDTSYHSGGSIAVYLSVDPGAYDTTGLTWGWWGSGYDFMVQVFPLDTVMFNRTGYQQPVWQHDQAGAGWTFEVMDTMRGAWVAWNQLNNQCEVAIPKTLLYNPTYLPGFVIPDTLAVMIYAGENGSPWRADYACNAGVSGYLLSAKSVTAVEEKQNAVPKGYSLAQNYPNPFNPSAKIEYSLAVPGYVNLKVFNILGQEVQSLVNMVQTAGQHSVIFNASALPSGVYFYTLQSGNYHMTRKMMLVK